MERYSEWIPVSERLPEKAIDLLVTTRYGEVKIAVFDGRDWVSSLGDEHEKLLANEVFAWMSLPESYRVKYRKKPVVVYAYQTAERMDIETLEGTMHASVGDYIITGVHGEQYPCKPDIFAETYELAEDGQTDVREDVYGMWVEDDTGAAYCSHCGEYPYDDGEYRLASWKPKYCPNCGAGMVREKVRMNDEQK